VNKPFPDDMDAFIEAALKEEPLRPVPFTLQRRVEERVRIAQLREKECQRFRYSMTSLLVGALSVVGIAVCVIAVTHFHLIMSNGVSGGWGQYDALVNSLFQTMGDYSGAYTLVFSMFVAAGTLLLGLIPLRKYMSTH